jgi:magnesium transporter
MIVDMAVYHDGTRGPALDTIAGARSHLDTPGSFIWVGLFEPTAEEFEEVRKEFDLHELAVEDAIQAHQRPKLEVYDDTLFVVLKTARYLDREEEVEFGEILMFLGRDFVVVVRHGEAASLVQVRRSLERRPDILRIGPSAVLHAVMDRVVDGYTPVLEGLHKDIDEVEKEVFSVHWSNPAQRIYLLKREVLEFQDAAGALVEPLDRLARGRFAAVDEDIREFFQDVHDHAVLVSGTVEQYRDLLTSILEANLAQLSVHQNEDMRKISAWVAVAVVPTLIAGIFGMNFDRIPGAHQWWGFPSVVLIMAVIALVLYRAFRKSGWL